MLYSPGMPLALLAVIADCAACGEADVPFGTEQLLAGAFLSVVVLIPLALLHLGLRRRGR